MGSVAAMCIPSLIKIDLGIPKLIQGIKRQKGDCISLVSPSQNKENRLIIRAIDLQN